MPKHNDQQNGFTTIELVVVILLIGIIAAVSLPRLTGTQSFHNLLLKDALIAQARLAQQIALSRFNQPVRFEISRPEDWQLDVRVDINTNGNFDLLLDSKTLERGNGSLSLANPGKLTLDGTNTLTLDYDGLGNVVAVNGKRNTANILFAANDRIVCISNAGYSYEAADTHTCLNPFSP